MKYSKKDIGLFTFYKSGGSNPVKDPRYGINWARIKGKGIAERMAGISEHFLHKRVTCWPNGVQDYYTCTRKNGSKDVSGQDRCTD